MRFRIAVAERGTDQTTVVREAIERWLDAGTDSASGLEQAGAENRASGGVTTIAPGRRLSKPLTELIPMLEEILSRPETRKSFKEIVRMFAFSGAGGAKGETETRTAPTRRGGGAK